MITKNQIPYFKLTYKLLEKVEGKLVPFNKQKLIYDAYIIAKTAEIAIERLKRDFHMLTVEVMHVSEKKLMPVNEYLNGGQEI